MGRLTAGTSGVALLAAWGVCVARYATAGAGDYNGGVFIPLLMLAVVLTAVAGLAAVRSWKEESGAAAVMAALAAVPVTSFAKLANSSSTVSRRATATD
jgi:hypothetical protein